MRKFKNSKGFTLVEMLIVVAIIAILIAISIPLVNNALERARHATDDANFRAAAGVGTIEYLSDADNVNGTYYYYTNKASQGKLGDADGKDTDGNTIDTTEFSLYVAKCTEEKGTNGNGETGTFKEQNIKVEISDDGDVTVTWAKKS